MQLSLTFKILSMKNKVIAYIAYFLLFAQIVLTAIILIINKTIPTHWNFSGEIDATGSPYNILIITAANIFSFLFLSWLGKHPEYCNFPRPFKNQELAFSNIYSLCNRVRLYMSVLFLYMTIVSLYPNLPILTPILLLMACLMYTTIKWIIKLGKS